MKRARTSRASSSLTGGTGDVSPQFISFRATQSAADTTTTITQTLPVDRITTHDAPTIIEVLKVFFKPQATPTEVDNRLAIFLTTKNFATTAIDWNESSCFAAYQRHILITTSGQFEDVTPFVLDVTDGAGHGILIGTDNIFAQVQSATTSATNSIDVKILYRYKRVGLSEYIGIVQSQQ